MQQCICSFPLIWAKFTELQAPLAHGGDAKHCYGRNFVRSLKGNLYNTALLVMYFNEEFKHRLQPCQQLCKASKIHSRFF